MDDKYFQRKSSVFLAALILFLIVFGPVFISGTATRAEVVLAPLIVFLIFILRKVKFPKPVTVVLSLLLAAGLLKSISIILQLIFNITDDYISACIAIYGALRPALFAVLFSAILNLINIKKLKRLLEICLYLSIAMGVLSVLSSDIDSLIRKIYLLPVEAQTYRFSGHFQKVHGAAFFYSLALVLLVYLGSEATKKKKLSFWIFGLLCAYLILITYSKVTYLYFFLIFVIVAIRHRLVSHALIGLGFVPLFIFLTQFVDVDLHRRVKSSIELLYLTFGSAFGSEVSESASFVSARLEHGWLAGLRSFHSSPFIGNISSVKKQFVGDGGYIEILGFFGILGAIGFLLEITALIYAAVRLKGSICRAEQSVVLVLLVNVLIFSLATSYLKERTVELFFPVLIIVLLSGLEKLGRSKINHV